MTLLVLFLCFVFIYNTIFDNGSTLVLQFIFLPILLSLCYTFKLHNISSTFNILNFNLDCVMGLGLFSDNSFFIPVVVILVFFTLGWQSLLLLIMLLCPIVNFNLFVLDDWLELFIVEFDEWSSIPISLFNSSIIFSSFSRVNHNIFVLHSVGILVLYGLFSYNIYNPVNIIYLGVLCFISWLILLFGMLWAELSVDWGFSWSGDIIEWLLLFICALVTFFIHSPGFSLSFIPILLLYVFWLFSFGWFNSNHHLKSDDYYLSDDISFFWVNFNIDFDFNSFWIPSVWSACNLFFFSSIILLVFYIFYFCLYFTSFGFSSLISSQHVYQGSLLSQYSPLMVSFVVLLFTIFVHYLFVLFILIYIVFFNRFFSTKILLFILVLNLTYFFFFNHLLLLFYVTYPFLLTNHVFSILLFLLVLVFNVI